MASEEFLGAAVLRAIAQLSLHGDTADKRAIYAQSLGDYEKAASHAARSWQRMDGIGASLACWLLRPETTTDVPVVLVWGGASGWGLAYHRLAQALLRAGLAVALVELPGQGEPRLRNGYVLTPGFTDALVTLYDRLAAQPGLDGRLGVLGNSLGGLLAARAAADDDRVLACCVNGGIPEPHTIVERYPRQRVQWGAMIGENDPRALSRAWADYAVTTIPGRIRCPLLVLHGDQDPLVNLPDARRFAAAAGHGDVVLARWPEGIHCLYNVAGERDALLASWFSRILFTHPACPPASSRTRGASDDADPPSHT